MLCPNCHGSYEKEGRCPLLLPSCGHSVCRVCLQRFTQHNGFLCPACGKKQPIVNLSDLFPNHALLDIIEVKIEDNGSNGKKKKRHKSRGRGRSTARGKVEDQQDKGRDQSIETSKETLCVEHDEVRLSYWCGPCGVAVCGECVVEGHLNNGGDGGGRKHEAVRIETAIKTRRSEMQDSIFEIIRVLDIAEKKHTTFTKSSPFIASAKKLQAEVGAAMGKMGIVASLLACLIQNSEKGDVGLLQLRQDLDKLMQKTLPLTSGNVAEIRALLEHLKSIEAFRDGPMSKVLKEINVKSKENKQSFLYAASDLTSTVNKLAIALCKQVVSCGDGCHLEVVGSGGAVGTLTWERERLHLHCLRRSPTGYSHKPATDPARHSAVKWAMVHTQIHEVTQVFLEVSWAAHGQTAAGKEQVYFKLYLPDTTTTTSSCKTAHRRFLHLVLADDDDSKNTLLGPLVGDVQQMASGRVILLGTHHLKEEESVQKKSEETVEAAATPGGGNTVSPVIISAGDVISTRGRQHEGDLEFWLVLKGVTRTMKLFGGCEVVGSLLPAHNSWLAKLLSLKSVKAVDCGAVLCSQILPPPDLKNGGGRKQKPHSNSDTSEDAFMSSDKV